MRFSQLCIAGSAAAGLVLLATTTASAEPSPGTFRDYPGVGSETTQDVWTALAGSGRIGSYNAFGSPAEIQTKPNGPFFTRPAGSGEGVAALSASVTGGTYRGIQIKDQVAWARSSSGPANGSGLTYLPFARDAVSVAYNVPSGQTSATVVNFTQAELQKIYNCSQTTIVVGGTTIKVNPKLPQTGSGTRKFFLKAVGVKEETLPVCVKTVGEENNGSQIPADGDLIPFSAAQWTAQKSGAVRNTVSAADLKIATIGGKAPSPTASNSLYGPLTAPPTSNDPFARDTYNVIPSTQAGTDLETLLNAGGNNKATVEKFGFGKLSYVGDKARYQSGAYAYIR